MHYLWVNSEVKNVSNIQTIITKNEEEALLLENTLIKEFKPKYNVQFKDDKGYPWIKIETKKNFPCKTVFGLKRGSTPHGEAWEDLPQGLFDVLDPFLRVLNLDLWRFLWKCFFFGGQLGVLKVMKIPYRIPLGNLYLG